MKNSRSKQLAIATVGAWWLRSIIVPMKAFHHSRTALRDERNGFSYSAALQWRHAAELLHPNTLVQSTAGGNGNALCTCRGDSPIQLAFLSPTLSG